MAIYIVQVGSQDNLESNLESKINLELKRGEGEGWHKGFDKEASFSFSLLSGLGGWMRGGGLRVVVASGVRGEEGREVREQGSKKTVLLFQCFLIPKT